MNTTRVQILEEGPKEQRDQARSLPNSTAKKISSATATKAPRVS